jgi:transcriptional regulator with XRE-family HTH domain
MNMPLITPLAFAQRLKGLRERRRFSQMALALEADVSQRHVSYLEIGRARPSRDMVLRLASTLSAGPRETNALLTAAGFAPHYPESGLDAPALATVREAVERLLTSHAPNPAVLIDGAWSVKLANRPARLLLGVLFPGQAIETINLARALFDPALLRPMVEDFDTVGSALLGRLIDEALPGTPAEALLALLAGYPDVGRLTRSIHSPAAREPLLTLALSLPLGRIAFFSTITTLGTPRDITLHEARIETFFPADEATEMLLRRLFATTDAVDPD